MGNNLKRLVSDYEKLINIKGRFTHEIGIINSKMINMQNAIGVEEYGEIGSTRMLRSHDGKTRSVKIKMFVENLWSSIPICVIDMDLNGQTIETHIINGNNLLK